MKSPALLLLLGLSTAACGDADDAADHVRRCEALCKTASTCGLLPSGLGVDAANCKARCAKTDEEVSASVLACNTVDAELDEIGWCGDKLGCEELSTCLASVVADEPLVGRGELRIRLELLDERPAGTSVATWMACPWIVTPGRDACEEPGTADAEPAGCRTTPGGTAECLCPGVGIAKLGVSVATAEGRTEASPRGCVFGLDDDYRFTDLVPGVAQASVHVRGRYADPAAGEAADGCVEAAAAPPTDDFCWKFYSAPQVVQAGQTTDAVILLPGSVTDARELFMTASSPEDGTRPRIFACDERGAACADEHDNDDDGFVDCADPECAADCPAAGAVPSGLGAAGSIVTTKRRPAT